MKNKTTESPAHTTDLIDQLATKLEHLRTVTWSVVDQLDRINSGNGLRDVVSGEVGLIYSQLVESQHLVDQLSVDASQDLM